MTKLKSIEQKLSYLKLNRNALINIKGGKGGNNKNKDKNKSNNGKHNGGGLPPPG